MGSAGSIDEVMTTPQPRWRGRAGVLRFEHGTPPGVLRLEAEFIMGDPQALEVTLNYVAASSPVPVVHVSEPPAGEPRDSTEISRHTVSMHDARDLFGQLSLDEHGFEVVHHETRAHDLWDPEQVREVYFEEMERLVADATGAAKVLAFDHNVRSFAKARAHQDGASMPVKFAHNDYTLKSGPQRVRDLLPEAEAERRLKRRFAVINVWKPITGPVLDTPLAVCDARTLKQEDFVETDLVYSDRVGEVYSVAFSEAHRWYYVSEMRSDEALLLKCYDSVENGCARFTAHTAFKHPSSPPDAPTRESIEVRTLAFFDGN